MKDKKKPIGVLAKEDERGSSDSRNELGVRVRDESEELGKYLTSTIGNNRMGVSCRIRLT